MTSCENDLLVKRVIFTRTSLLPNHRKGHAECFEGCCLLASLIW